MRIRGILLDKDGTILDYDKTWIPINREAARFAACGDPRLIDELLAIGGHDPVTNRIEPGCPLAAGSIDEIADLFAAHLGHLTPPDLVAGIDRIFCEGGARYAVLIDGVHEAVAALHGGGYRLGIATNDTIGGLKASLSRHRGLLELCEFLAGCDSGFGAKPGPGMVHAFSEQTGLDPREIAIVGDAVPDLEMGRRAGVGLKVAVLSGTSPREVLAPHADLVVGSVRDLPAALRR